MRTLELGLFCAISLVACGGESGVQAGGHTNWLTCKTLADCASNPAAVACTDGYCVDDKGNRLPAGTATDGGVRRDAGQSGAGGASTGGQSGNGGASGASGGSGAGGASGGAANGGAGGGVCSGAPGCGEEGTACCDPFPCDGPNFCHGTLSCCGSACHASCADAGGGIRMPVCPGPMTERCASERCVTGGTCVTCSAGQVCVEVEISCGPAGGTTAQCIPDPCGGQTLDCSCAETACNSVRGSALTLVCNVYTKDNFLVGPNRDPFLGCSGGGICASPDTPIATPDGEVPIARLRPGDLVYSIDSHGIVSVPIARVARTPVTRHHVLRIEVEGGRAIEVSAPHPVLDGRRLDALIVGDRLDGHRIVAIDRIPYRYGFTHDILPASDTGAYLAGGVWLGSTLAKGRSEP